MKWKIILLIGIVAFIGIFLYKEYNKEEAYPLPDEDQMQTLLNNEVNADKSVLGDQIGLSAGQTPPDFELNTLTEGNFQLRDYKGKKVGVKFLGQLVSPMSCGNARYAKIP